MDNILLPACRSCGEANLNLLLSLGQMPLANALLTKAQLSQPEATYPLDLAFCPRCTLVQITETVPPQTLFREYLYFSSFSEAMLSHARQLTQYLTAAHHLKADSLVLEIASNDGYLLQYYQQQGIPVLGIEPAVNVAQVARDQRNIPTVTEFFDDALAKNLVEQGYRADVIHAHNVLAHVANLNGVVRGLQILLKDKGVAVIEVPYLKDLIDHCEFDTIYHEHLCYFSLTALHHLFQRHHLMIADVERITIHGGSLRLFVTHSHSDRPGERVQRLLEAEETWGMNDLPFYQDFTQSVETLKITLHQLLTRLKQSGHSIAAYGAAAKGTILLNYMGIGAEILDFVVDRSTYKQGLYLPGVHLLINDPEKLLKDKPDYVLLLAWNFVEEILTQQADYRQQGGQFIIPIPEPKVL